MEISSDVDISIYPNPAYQNLYLTIENGAIGKVDVFDPLGKKVLSASSETNLLELDISKLSKGLYFINFENIQSSQKGSFIKL